MVIVIGGTTLRAIHLMKSCSVSPLARVVQWPRPTVLPWSEGSTGASYEVDDSKV
jgi:hypothetical protein